MMYKFDVIDPRPQSREAEVARLQTVEHLIGIEVTIPHFAELCDVNIDPQHSNQPRPAELIPQAAIDAALIHPLPPDGAVLTTVRPDLDSIGAMAVLSLRADYPPTCWSDVVRRVAAVAKADTHGRGEWPGPRPLPTVGSIPEIEAYFGIPAGLSAIVGDFRLPIAVRVSRMREWLLTGTCDGLDAAQWQAEAEHDDAIQATKLYAIYKGYAARPHGLRDYPCSPDDILELCGSPVACFVESAHRGALGLGYYVAPVVIAVNEHFVPHGEDIGRKYTIAQYHDGYADLNGVRLSLNELESGWGGSSTILGSPQGQASTIDHETVVEIVMMRLYCRVVALTTAHPTKGQKCPE